VPPDPESFSEPAQTVALQPFDPAAKMSEATATDSSLGTLRIVKGAFIVVAAIAAPSPSAAAAANELEAKGFRVLAVAAGPPAAMQLMGLIALSDPARDDSPAMVAQLKNSGSSHGDGDRRCTRDSGDCCSCVGLDGRCVRPDQFQMMCVGKFRRVCRRPAGR